MPPVRDIESDKSGACRLTAIASPRYLSRGCFETTNPKLSPDGRWVASSSNDSVKSEVYVQNFPPSGNNWQVSTNGGDEPQWRGDGKELFYLAKRQSAHGMGRGADYRFSSARFPGRSLNSAGHPLSAGTIMWSLQTASAFSLCHRSNKERPHRLLRLAIGPRS